MIKLAAALKAKWLTKTAYVRKLPSGKWRVYSEKGKNLGTFDSESAAKKHLREIEYFKHRDKSDANDHPKSQESYSAVLRELNRCGDKAALECFLSTFKTAFDQFVLEGDKEPAEKALPIALLILCREHGG